MLGHPELPTPPRALLTIAPPSHPVSSLSVVNLLNYFSPRSESASLPSQEMRRGVKQGSLEVNANPLFNMFPRMRLRKSSGLHMPMVGMSLT